MRQRRLLNQAKVTRRKTNYYNTVGSSGEATAGGYHGDDGIQTSFHLWRKLRPMRQ